MRSLSSLGCRTGLGSSDGLGVQPNVEARLPDSIPVLLDHLDLMFYFLNDKREKTSGPGPMVFEKNHFI